MAAVITLTLGFVFNWRSNIGKRSLSKHDGFTFIKMELITSLILSKSIGLSGGAAGWCYTIGDSVTPSLS